ncbi:ATP-binding protein, partial [Bacteriovoracaceae bacterium]|nr:ATP-binding protein [Bacteriovoracaceae bacterium]
DEKVLVAKFVTPPSHPNIQIGFAIFSSYNRILSGLKFIRSQSIAISFLLILLTAFVGWYVVKYLLKNLNTITDSAKRYTQGESDINIKVNSSDEIGTLALTFQGMIRQVNERARVLRKSERTIREARDQAEKALNSKSQLLDDIKRQNEEIETMAKDKDELLAIVSHDLKNPLAIVETSMDILLEEAAVKGNSQIKDLVRRSKTNARYALNLITDLLDLARMEGGIKLDFDVFNVNEMIETILDSLDIKAKEKNISFITNFDGTYNIKADYGRIVQVINNVVGNALKFVPKDGTIKIILEKFESNRKVDGNSSFLRIKIEDNGPGIPKSKLKTIFNKFSQARESDRKIGTGLGLAICENIVGKHTGSIMVESVEGHGATFL